jgi:hypothetical protein
VLTTNGGYKPIEQVKLTDTIGGKKIKHVTCTKSIIGYLIYIPKNALGKTIPFKNTLVSPDHKIFVRGKMKSARYLLTLYDYFGKGIARVPYEGQTMYNILLDISYPGKMVVNGMQTETLNPANKIAKLYANTTMSSSVVKTYNRLYETEYKQKGKSNPFNHPICKTIQR